MEDVTATEETVQVTEVGDSPHSVGSEEETQATETSESTTETTETESQPTEAERLAAEADQLIESGGTDITAPGTETQTQTEETAQPGPTLEQTVNWMANQIYEWQQNGFPGQGQATPNPESDDPGTNDIYNSTFDNSENTEERTQAPTLEEFQTLQQEVQRLRSSQESSHAELTEIKQSDAQKTALAQEQQEVAEIMEEHTLSEQDARRALVFFKRNEYGKAVKFIQAQSQVTHASEESRETRAADRQLAGRPAVTGGTASQPTSNNAKLEAKMEEYKGMPDGPEREDLGMEIIDLGGMELLRKEALDLIRNPKPPVVAEGSIL